MYLPGQMVSFSAIGRMCIYRKSGIMDGEDINYSSALMVG